MSASSTRAKLIFLSALEVSSAERAAFLEEACGGDAALRREVESLLEFHEGSQDLAAAPGSGGERAPGAPPHAPYAGQAAGASFLPGEVFAGRYRMIERIGRGGMGDVWRADDLVLETAVALKLILSAGADARARILNEVRLARRITHPAVCRVFDVGESDGVIFFTMELVDGEDLATLLRRVGRLPPERVVEIGLQLCAGLAAAHAQGVLHRDLKPANVLVDDAGRVRVSDFGIAIPRQDAGRHALTGTPAYMAPEQRTPGMAVSERTDVYALGLVLYDLLVGRHRPPWTQDARIPPPSAEVPNLDPRLDRIIMAALSTDPAGRPASVLDVASVLSSIAESGRHAGRPSGFLPRIRSPWIAGGALAAAILLLVAAASVLVAPGARTLTERDTIVLADFENSTGEPVFDGTLKVALAVALEQSPFLKVFPDERARETLRLMERSPDERITKPVAREIARREQLKALIAGSIVRLGEHYVLAIEAVNAQTGDVMAREQAEASSREQVLTSLGGASSRLRQKLGESLASVQRFDVPLPRATTPSLDALHAYSLALYEGRAVPRLEAIPHLARAIELDPTFAMAHALMSAVYANTGQSALAPAHAEKAFELRDRVSDRERFFISWRYYRDGLQAWDKALELARTWTATYPREAFAFNSLANALIRVGDFEGSVAPLREAIRLDPQFIPAYSNLAASLLALGRLDEARTILRQAHDRGLDFAGARRLSYLVAFVQGDADTMSRELAASLETRDAAALGWEAHTLAARGRLSAAHEQYRRGVQMARQGGFAEIAAHLNGEDAEMHAMVGDCADGTGEASEALALARDNTTLERAARVLALCGRAGEASKLSAELGTRFPQATLITRVSIPVIEASIAMQRGDAARSIELLDPVRQYDHAPSGEFWPRYVRAQAYLRLSDGAAAETQFRSIVDHQGEVPTSLLYPLAHIGLARSALLVRDRTTARGTYERLFSIWKDADAALRPLADGRAEYARLE